MVPREMQLKLSGRMLMLGIWSSENNMVLEILTWNHPEVMVEVMINPQKRNKR